MKNLFFSISLLSAALLSSCTVDANGRNTTLNPFENIEASENIIHETRNVSPFEGIKVSNAIEVVVDDTNFAGKISVDAPDNYMSKIKTEVVNGVLKLYIEGNMNFNSHKIVVTIPHQKLRSFDLSGASKVNVKPTLKVENMMINLSGASALNLTLMSNKVTVENSGASSLTVGGNAQNLVTDISGASKFNAEKLKVSTAMIECSGASSATVWVVDQLNVNASGASKVSYVSQAGLKTKIDTSGASKVKHI